MPWTFGTPRLDSYDLQDESPVDETEVEQGPVRVVQVSSQYETYVSVSVHLTDSELQAFRTFLETEARHGAAYFDMPLKTTNSVATHSVRIVPNSVRISPVGPDVNRAQFRVRTPEHIA